MNKKQVEFQIGDRVRVHFPTAEEEGAKYKLGVRWRGPYVVVNKIDRVTYRVKTEDAYKIKTMPVHVQRMKLCKE